jgi:hypothetical protein
MIWNFALFANFSVQIKHNLPYDTQAGRMYAVALQNMKTRTRIEELFLHAVPQPNEVGEWIKICLHS